MDIFAAIGVGIACVGVWLIATGARDARKSEVTQRDIVKWRTRAGKQSFSVPWNMPLEIVVAFVRAWRKWDAGRKLGLGAAIFAFGVVVALFNALRLVSVGEIVEVLYQYLAIVFYPFILIAAYLGISRLSHSQRADDMAANQRPLRDYRHPLVPALGIILLPVYAALLVIVIARLTHGFDPTVLAQVLAWPELWGLFFGLLVMLAAIVVTEVVVRRIATQPTISFLPANGWERLADYVLRAQAISDCYVATLFALIIAAFSASFLVYVRPLDLSGMGGGYGLYILLVGLVSVVVAIVLLFHAPAPSSASVDTAPETAEQSQQ